MYKRAAESNIRRSLSNTNIIRRVECIEVGCMVYNDDDDDDG